MSSDKNQVMLTESVSKHHWPWLPLYSLHEHIIISNITVAISFYSNYQYYIPWEIHIATYVHSNNLGKLIVDNSCTYIQLANYVI